MADSLSVLTECIVSYPIKCPLHVISKTDIWYIFRFHSFVELFLSHSFISVEFFFVAVIFVAFIFCCSVSSFYLQKQVRQEPKFDRFSSFSDYLVGFYQNRLSSKNFKIQNSKNSQNKISIKIKCLYLEYKNKQFW